MPVQSTGPLSFAGAASYIDAVHMLADCLICRPCSLRCPQAA